MVNTRSSGGHKPSKSPSTKRSHDQVEESTDSPAKRTRGDGGDYIFQFARGETITNSDDEVTRSASSKSLADTIRRERRERAERKAREQLYGKSTSKDDNTPRPGSIRASSRSYKWQQKQAMQAASDRSDGSPEPSKNNTQHEREARDRSAAPEPETPQRGLFGSLRNLGSSTIGRALSTIGNLTPLGNKLKSVTPDKKGNSASTQPQTEPPKRAIRKPAWEIDYPAIPNPDDIPKTPTRRMFGEVPESAKVDKEDDSESEKKRKAFIRAWGEPDPNYDHLHLVPLEGRPEDLPYPPKKKAVETEYVSTATEQEKAFFRARRARREAILGKPPVEEIPTKAPLFGPNSHYVRKTRAPEISNASAAFTSSIDPIPIFGAGSKRKFVIEGDANHQPAADKQQPMHATVEDAPQSPETNQHPSTPAAKRQKTFDGPLQTPRSAMKTPGSMGRSGRNVVFNRNPVSSVRKFSPVMGDRRAGDRPFVPGDPYNTFTEEMEYAEKQRQKASAARGIDSPLSVASTESYTVSPNTFANTQANRYVPDVVPSGHPGDALTQMINSTLPKVQYVWSDPNDPDWRPSLANPSPGTFRYVFEDEEDSDLENLADLEEEETGKRPERRAMSFESEPESPLATPPQPAAPRMSHAELPKPPTPSAATSASGLEAANLERRRAEAAKTKPRTGSRLAEVTTAQSRSPSPPPLDATTASDDNDSIQTLSPTPESGVAMATGHDEATWTWTSETNEHICSNSSLPDFAYNLHDELIPSFCLRTSAGAYDDSLIGPDGMTEAMRQKHYMAKWAEKESFDWDEPQTYEESGCGTKFIHELLKMNERKHPGLFEASQERMEQEWNEHQGAIEKAEKEGRELVATYPDREWMEEPIEEEL